jgi:hypothetical protein
MLSTNQEYKDQIKKVGEYNLKDTYKWRERATFFQENEYYTDLIEDTHDWNEFWDEEERRIMNGLWIDGFYIPGLYYFYLNYLPIYRKQDSKYDFADVYDMDYHTFLCLEHAVFLKQDFVVIKKRQSGFTLKFCSTLIRELFFSRGSPNYIATYEEAQVLKTWVEVVEPYREHLNTYTAWYREFTPSKPLNWRAAKQVISESGRNITVGRKNSLKGLILSKSPSKGVGGGAKWIFGDECFGKDTPVLMSDYSVKKIQDIQKGEFVLGSDGQPKEVINFCSGIDQMYEIQQRKGLNFTVNSKHKLVLEKRNHRTNNGIKHLTAEEYLNLDKYSLRTHYGIKNQTISYPTSELKLNSYFLGLWLGDGSTNACEIIINLETDIEILEFLKGYVKSISYTYKLKKCNAPTCKMFRIKSNFKHNILTKEMKRLGIFSDKRIPLSYIKSSEEDRLQLLAGLIDSDGYLAKGTASYSFSYEISVTKKDFAKDIKILARSLGFYVSERTKPAKKTTLKNGHIINTKEYCSIQIRGDIKRIPVRVARKRPPKDYVKLKENNHLITSFKIQSKGLGKYYGIEIEGDSKLFLLEDFTVVHNCGVNPVLSKFKGYIESMMYYGNVKTGTIIFSGAVGELKHLEGGLKEYIQYPEKNGFYAVDNLWDVDNEFSGRKCGFFVPESWAYFGIDDDQSSEFYGQPFIDEHGNSFVERAEHYIRKKRLGLIGENSKEADKFSISQAPLNLAECFQYRGDNVFPTDLINPQIAKVEKNEDHGTFIDLYRTQDGVVKHKLLSKYDNKPILEHPIDPKRKDKDGVIQVWEFPPPNRQTYGVYWAGIDIVASSVSNTSPSLNSIHIYKGSHNLSDEYTEDRIVAKFMSRTSDKMDFYKKAMLLLEWYNAEALIENNITWFIEEAIKSKEQFRLARNPQWARDITPQGISHINRPYGVLSGVKLIDKMIEAISSYIKEPTYVTYDENTGEPTQHYGVERIRDLQLLRELINYRPKKEYEKGNYDAVFSFGLALLHAKNSEVLGIIPEDTKENVNFNQKSAKLMLRNRFSHTNLKKLSNAYNIQ